MKSIIGVDKVAVYMEFSAAVKVHRWLLSTGQDRLVSQEKITFFQVPSSIISIYKSILLLSSCYFFYSDHRLHKATTAKRIGSNFIKQLGFFSYVCTEMIFSAHKKSLFSLICYEASRRADQCQICHASNINADSAILH